MRVLMGITHTRLHGRKSRTAALSLLCPSHCTLCTLHSRRGNVYHAHCTSLHIALCTVRYAKCAMRNMQRGCS